MYRDEWKGQENQAKATYQRNWLAVPPRRKDQRGKKSKAVRPNLMEKTPYSRIKPPREENLKISKKFQKFQKFPSYTTYYAEGVFYKHLSRNDTKK